MKKTLAIIVLISTIGFAQKADTTAFASKDSIDLHALVDKQMTAAIEKQLQEKLNPKPIVVVTNVVEKPAKIEKGKSAQANANPFFDFIMTQPWQYKTFALISVIILGFVFIRRFILSFTRTSTKALKKKIGLMREERVGGSKENPKLAKTRRVLKENLELFKQSDGQIGKRARQLNLSKGELLLAARLKLYEVGKM
ncbi:MAG: hypothetical protein FD122_775 [Stygiobacter sp.]|nr:MAG: hypothetical protein FD122_775 [Stygiobacter sp.]KAF0216491.1 MAG: hypothetical protein FD178_1192 [Ignavibacteria bacterium]RJQ58973.1 MAG: hypothetical protein C4517_13865 [Stygiobacter sp.]